jgi:tetratricopeptide (TPR) repeat protein
MELGGHDMVMQKIRRSKKTMRVPLIIMTLVLAFGLIGSFAIWSAPDVNNNAGTKKVTPEEQIKNLQSSIDTWEKSLKEKPKDFSLLKSIADVRTEQAGLYAQTGNQTKSIEVYTKGLENYLTALDNAPAELNNKGKSDILVKAAMCAWQGQQVNTAETLLKKARSISPSDYATVYSYVFFLISGKQNFQLAKEELAQYKAALKSGDPQLESVNNLIKGIEEIEKQNSKKNNDTKNKKDTGKSQEKSE